MSRYKIIIQYDGLGFKGWQLQKEERTIQGELESSLKTLNNGKLIRIYGAGRTDTGVHATGQVAHFDFDRIIGISDLKKALNGNLPKDIRIMDCVKVSEEFHARFTAVKRYYLYRIRTDGFLLDRNYSWNIESLDIKKLNEIAQLFIGNNDFTSFSRNNKNLEHRRCIIFESVWKGDNALVNYTITGNRFLHHMVRYLVGTMVEVARGNYAFDEFKTLIDQPRENVNIFKAPPKGLVLTQVDYD